MKKTRLNEKEKRLAIIAAASLSSENRTQKEIAKILGFSQPQISDFLKLAVKLRILGVAPPLLEKNFSPEEKEQAEAKYLASGNLYKKLKPCNPQHIYFDVREFAGGEEQFAHSAAIRVLQLLPRSELVGIMSGRTMHRLVESIKSLTASSHLSPDHSIECIPLCGDPIHLMNLRLADYSASHLAATVAQSLTEKTPGELPCLIGVPAYVSTRLQNEGFKQFLNSIPGYRDIFVGPNEKGRPMVDRTDTLITGIGVISADDDKTSAFIRERIKQQEEESKEKLNEIILGDIGGLLIERKASDRKRVNELNEGWIGIREQHFRQIAEGARKNGPPGIILIAYGSEEKAELVLKIMERGWVNHLLIHSALSKHLQALIAARKNKPHPAHS